MQYRKFGPVDWQASVLGFGAMRLPLLEGDRFHGEVDVPQAIGMIRSAIDAGVNYVDTSYVYHDGKSEGIVARALRDGYRAKVRIATKLPVWSVQSPADFDRLLGEQLERLETDHIDFYLLHALDRPRWRNIVLKHDLLAKSEAALRDGRIRHLGFSFHDTFEGFPEILNSYDRWEFCQIQYNYMDTENQAGERGLRMAAERGLAIVVMEPMLGGRLSKVPPAIAGILARPRVDGAVWSPTDWALHWVWNHPEVAVVLSGMSTPAQVRENLAAARGARANALTSADHAVIAQAQAAFKARAVIPCTKCNYCLPCPSGVNVPMNFELFNDAGLYDDVPGAKLRYNIFLPEPQRASACVGCGECLAKCPQKIEISTWLPKVHAALGSA